MVNIFKPPSIIAGFFFGIITNMALDENLIREIVRRILNVVKPDRIILFGSAVAGTMNRDSDIDLLILERTPVEISARRMAVRKNLRGLGFPFDILIMSTERFEETKDVIGGIAYPANKYGRIIYEL